MMGNVKAIKGACVRFDETVYRLDLQIMKKLFKSSTLRAGSFL